MKTIDSETKEDMEFLLNFVPATDPIQVQEGLVSVCYITGEFAGDVKLAEKIKKIIDKYSLSIPENDLDS